MTVSIPGVRVIRSATVPWRTVVVASDPTGEVAFGPGQTVVMLGDQAKFDEPRTERVRRMAVLEAIEYVRRNLGGQEFTKLDWEMWHPCPDADLHHVGACHACGWFR